MSAHENQQYLFLYYQLLDNEDWYLGLHQHIVCVSSFIVFSLKNSQVALFQAV